MKANRWLSLAPFLFAAVLCLARLGDLPLVQPDEGRNAEIAREMKDSGAWLVPTYDGIPYLDKPAFHFRVVATSLALFGENERAARVPSAGFALALLAVLFLFCRRFYGPRCAAFAVAIVAASPLFFAFARIVILDMPLALFVTVSILAGFMCEEGGGAGRRWSLVSTLGAGLATLVKGPVGFLVPLLVLAVHQASARNGRAILRLFGPANLVLFALVVLPWFLGVTHRHPDFPQYGIVEETFRRYTTSSFHRGGPVYYYAPVLLAVFFPWSVLLPESILPVLRGRARLEKADRLFLIWAAVVVLFFSTSRSKLPGYVLTSVIALGVLTARLFDRAIDRPEGHGKRLILRGMVTLAIVSAVLTVLLTLGILDPQRLRSLLRIRSGEFERLIPAFAPVLVSILLIGSVALAARLRRSVPLSFAAMALLPVALLTICFGGMRQYAESGSARSLARALPPLPPNTEVACVESFPSGLPFYIRREVVLLTRDGRELESNYIAYRLRRDADWPPTVVRLEERDRWLAARDSPIYLIAGRRGKAVLEEITGREGLSIHELQAGWWGVLLPVAGGR